MKGDCALLACVVLCITLKINNMTAQNPPPRDILEEAQNHLANLTRPDLEKIEKGIKDTGQMISLSTLYNIRRGADGVKVSTVRTLLQYLRSQQA